MSAPDGLDHLPDLDELVVAVADAVGADAAELGAETRLTDVCADSLDLYCLYLALDEWVPGFRLPVQLDVDLATLADVHHYLIVRAAPRRSTPGSR